MLRIVLIGAFVLGIAYVAITYNNLWVDNDKLSESNQQLKSSLADTVVALQNSREEKAGLLARITGLFSATANLSGIIAGYELRDSKAQAQIYQRKAEQVKTDQLIITSVSSLPRAAQLRAANRYVAGYGEVPKTDSGKVAMIAGLKTVVLDRDSTVAGQEVEIVSQRERANAEKKRADDGADKLSDLEAELNHVYNASADRFEQSIKGGFIGRGNRNRAAVNDVRAGRVKKDKAE